MSKSNRGFASMDNALRTKIAGQGGKKAHALGKAHKWTPAEATKAGRISVQVTEYRHGLQQEP